MSAVGGRPGRCRPARPAQVPVRHRVRRPPARTAPARARRRPRLRRATPPPRRCRPGGRGRRFPRAPRFQRHLHVGQRRRATPNRPRPAMKRSDTVPGRAPAQPRRGLTAAFRGRRRRNSSSRLKGLAQSHPVVPAVSGAKARLYGSRLRLRAECIPGRARQELFLRRSMAAVSRFTTVGETFSSPGWSTARRTSGVGFPLSRRPEARKALSQLAARTTTSSLLHGQAVDDAVFISPLPVGA